MAALRVELEDMPFDRSFYNDNGQKVNCHATGYMTFCTAIGEWYNEYEDSEGNIYLGR